MIQKAIDELNWLQQRIDKMIICAAHTPMESLISFMMYQQRLNTVLISCIDYQMKHNQATHELTDRLQQAIDFAKSMSVVLDAKLKDFDDLVNRSKTR